MFRRARSGPWLQLYDDDARRWPDRILRSSIPRGMVHLSARGRITPVRLKDETFSEVAAHNRPLCNILNATSAVIGHYLWSVRVQTRGWHERQIVSYVLFNYWPQKTFRKSFFHLRKRRNRGSEKSSWDLEKYLNLTKSSNNPTLRRTFLFLFLWLLLFCPMYRINRPHFAVCK